MYRVSALSMSLTDAAPETQLHLTSSRAKGKEAPSLRWFLRDRSQFTAAPLSVLSPHLPENASTFHTNNLELLRLSRRHYLGEERLQELIFRSISG